MLATLPQVFKVGTLRSLRQLASTNALQLLSDIGRTQTERKHTEAPGSKAADWFGEHEIYQTIKLEDARLRGS